jgi:hypothetical protein
MKTNLAKLERELKIWQEHNLKFSQSETERTQKRNRLRQSLETEPDITVETTVETTDENEP